MSDRLALAHAIEEAGIQREKAEGMATAIARFVSGSVATKADVEHVETALKADLAELRAATKADIAELRTASRADLQVQGTELKADISAVRADLQAQGTELKAEIAAARAELNMEIATVRTDLVTLRVATKADLDRLEAGLHADLRSEAIRLDRRLDLVSYRLLLSLGSLMVVLLGLLFAALHTWPPH